MPYVPLKVSIPEPCHEKWEEMTPQPDGRRHCASCSRNLVDFSYLTDREIHQFLRENHGRICGRWRKDQLLRPILPEVPKRKGLRAAAAVGGLLMATNLGAQSTEAPMTRGQCEVEEIIVGDIDIYPEIVEIPEYTIKVKGRIIDPSGHPLISAHFQIVGSENTRIVDFDGRFELDVLPNQVIEISAFEYESKRIAVTELVVDNGTSQLNVTLQPSAAYLVDEFIMGKTIRVDIPKEDSPQDPIKVGGIIVDSSGEPLIAANLRVLGVDKFAVSDVDGRFELDIMPDQAIEVSYVGYESTIISATELVVEDGVSQLNIVLQESTVLLEEPMIMGIMVLDVPAEPHKSEEPPKDDDKTEEVTEDQSRDWSVAYLQQAELFPNPVDDFIGVNFEVEQASTVTARLFDFEGRLLREWASRDLQPGKQTERFGIRYLNLPAGHFYLTLTDASSGVVETRVVVKN